MKQTAWWIGGLTATWCAVAAVAAGQAPPKKTVPSAKPQLSPEAAEYFEKHVRPVLAENCYSCHGAKSQQAGLRLDSLAGMRKGADGGKPAIVPGDPAHSPLIQAIEYTHDVKMPPQGKLPAPAIDALNTWVKMGAPWPGGGESAGGPPTGDSAAKHWAFQTVRKPALPKVANRAWIKSPIDAFVLARLEAKGLKPSPPADRRTLVRRAYFDLIGLPPSEADVQAFINDKSPTAYSKVIDRLLASPQYGERWARHWLDVARYADTKGYVFQEERRYPYSYTYRDYVIRAFNEDLPYDQFLTQQIAADRLELGDDKRPLAALGFLTLGRRFLNNQADIIDDRIDVVMRGTQALTVGCARCHDHKFDPIPQADYYSLYGVFASSTEPAELPLIAQPERSAAYLTYEKQLNALQADRDAFLHRKHDELLAQAKAKIADSLLAARDASRPGADVMAIAQKKELPGALVRRWITFLRDTGKADHPIFGPWHAFAALPDAEFAAKAAPLAAKFAANQDAQHLLNPAIAQAFAGAPPASLSDVANRYAAVLTAPTSDQQIEHALDSIGGPLNIAVDQIEPFFNRADRNQLQALQQKIDRFKATSPAAPPRAMVLVDSPSPVQPHIFRRGNPAMVGDAVPRQFLAVLSGPERKPFQQGSGRLELARAIASKDNPLTARVMVNRVWGWHFGTGLVRTTSDFGMRSDPPTNPELLDYLSATFMEEGWSMKKLHRLIMLSSTYQQSSSENPRGVQADPENSLLWRMNRRRLDFEQLRDSLLWAAGKLDLTAGGPGVDITTQPFATRRTVYGLVDRQNLPNLFRTFDFAGPDSSAPYRFVTTVPQQALFMMNSPFAVEQAKRLAARPEVAGAGSDEDRIRAVYRIVYARQPDPDEIRLGLSFLKAANTEADASGKGLTPWEKYAQVLLMSNEFAFVD